MRKIINRCFRQSFFFAMALMLFAQISNATTPALSDTESTTILGVDGVIDFENIDNGWYNGATTDPILTLAGVPIFSANLDGSLASTFQYAIWESGPNFGSDTRHFFSNEGVILDFTGLGSVVESVTFETTNSSTNQYISVNGNTVWGGILTNAPANIAPGVTLTVMGPAPGSSSGELFQLSGQIQTLFLGAEEFWLDDISYSFEAVLDCEFNSLTLTDIFCAGEDQANVTIQTEIINPTGNDLVIRINDVIHGFVDYDPSGMYVLEDLDVNSNGNNLLEIWVNGDPNCINEVDFYVGDCFNASECLLLEASLNGFDYYNNNTEPGDTLVLLENEAGVVATLENMSYDGIPQVFAAFEVPAGYPDQNYISGGGMALQFDFSNVVGIVNTLQFEVNFGGLFSISINDEELSFESVLDFANNPHEGFDVQVNEFTNPNGNTFSQVIVTGDTIQNYAMGAVNFAGFGNFCYNLTEFDCEITEFTVINDSCGMGNAHYFDYTFASNPVNDTFDVYRDGEFYSTILNSQLPSSFWVPGDGMNHVMEFVNRGDAMCSYAYDFEANVCPENCDLNFIITDCDCDGQANPDIFGVFGTIPLQDVVVFSIEELNWSQSAEVSDGIFQLNNVPLDYPNSYNLQVCYAGASGCCDESIISDYPDCTPCDFLNVSGSVSDCQPDGNFFVELAIEATGNDPDSAFIYLNGALYTTVAYADSPYNLGPFAGDETDREFFVVDTEWSGCENAFYVEGFTCPIAECDIVGFEFIENCETDGSFSALAAVIIENNTSNFFDFYVDGALFATEEITANELYDFTNVPLVAEQPAQVMVCVHDNPECCSTFLVESGPCDPGDCTIGAIDAYQIACDLPYAVGIDFEYSNTSGSFNLWGFDGINYGNYDFADLPIIIPNVDVLDIYGEDYQFLATDLQNSNCVGSGFYNALDCTPDCSINNVTFTNTGCIGNVALLEINMDFEGVGSVFTMEVDGNPFGTFNYSQIPFITDGFIADGVTTYQILIYDEIDVNCSVELEIGPFDCGLGDCQVSGLAVSDLICDNGELFGNIFFEVENPGNDFWEYWINGEYQGIETLNANNSYPVYLSEADPGNQNEIQVCINDQPDCCQAISFQALDCTPDCIIDNVEVSLGDCNSDGFFSATLDFIHDNTSDQFTVQGNGNNYGTFNYSDLPITIDGFEGNGTTIYELIAIDIDNNECQGFIDLGPIECSTGCGIENLIIDDVAFCLPDGTFGTIIDFETTLPGTDEYNVYLNNDIIGVYNTSGLPQTILHIDTDDTGSATLKVELVGDPDCVLETIFEIIECPTPSELCFDFNQVDPNLDLTPNNIGDLPVSLFGSTGVDVYLENCGDSNSFFAEILTGDYCQLVPNGDQYLFLQSGALVYDFNAVNPEQITFEFCSIGTIEINDSGQEYEFDIAQLGSVIDLGNGNSMEIFTITGGPEHGYIELNGSFEKLKICGLGSSFGPACMNYPPTVFDGECVSIDELETGAVYNSFNTATLPLELINQEGISLTVDACGPNDFFTLLVTEEDQCSPNLDPTVKSFHMIGAELEYDFANYPVSPSSIQFTYCGGGSLSIGEGTSYATLQSTNQIVNIGAGYLMESEIVPGSDFDYTVTVTGPALTSLRICGEDMQMSPICFSYDPPNQDQCYGFENLELFEYYGPLWPNMSLYNSFGLNVTMTDDLVDFAVLTAFNVQQTPPFAAAKENYAKYSGTLNFDFSGLNFITEFVYMDFSSEDFYVSVNNQPPVHFEGLMPEDTLLLIAPDVTLFYNRASGNPFEGNINLFGNVQVVKVGSENIQLDNICYYQEFEQIEVWPGDVNNDGLASHCDLIYLGIAKDSEGPARAAISEAWEPQFGPEWNEQFIFQEKNYKHADTNGDGVVDFLDYDVLEANLGLVHGDVPPFHDTEGTAGDPHLKVDLEANGPLVAGQPFHVPILLGDIAIPVDQLYGIAFTVNFNPEEILPNSMDISTEGSWLGDDLWDIQQVYSEEGRLDIAITRIDHADTTGYGVLANWIGVIDNLVGKIIQVNITNVKALTHDEKEVLVYGVGTNGAVTTSTLKDELQDGLHLFPVPTNNKLYIRNYNELELSQFSIFNIYGQKVYTELDPKQMNEIELNNLSSGSYFVEMNLEGNRIVSKIEVIKQMF